jgi:hypothetical protein
MACGEQSNSPPLFMSDNIPCLHEASVRTRILFADNGDLALVAVKPFARACSVDYSCLASVFLISSPEVSMIWAAFFTRREIETTMNPKRLSMGCYECGQLAKSRWRSDERRAVTSLYSVFSMVLEEVAEHSPEIGTKPRGRRFQSCEIPTNRLQMNRLPRILPLAPPCLFFAYTLSLRLALAEVISDTPFEQSASIDHFHHHFARKARSIRISVRVYERCRGNVCLSLIVDTIQSLASLHSYFVQFGRRTNKWTWGRGTPLTGG